MRKTLKSALSVVLSAAMVLTMGSVGSLTNNKSAKAADTTPDFTIKIAQNGNLWGWGEDLVKGDQVSLDIKDFGTYTLSADVPADSDDINSLGNALWIDTTLTDVPTDYDIVAKTVKVNDTEYDWSKTHAYKDGDTVRLGVVNGWAADSEEANPLAGQKVAVKTGDKLTFTFEVKSKSGDTPAEPTEAPSADPSATPGDATEAPSTDPSATPGDATEVPSADPTVAPTEVPADGKPNFTISIANNGNLWGWGGEITGDQVSLTVSDYGTYTLSADVPDDCDDINSLGNALWIDTTLTALPADYTLVPQTVKVNDTEYDWSKTIAYVDGDKVRFGVVNGWVPSDDEKYSIANPFDGQPIAVKKGDKLTFTFEVKEGAAAPTEAPTQAPTQAPTEAPTEAPAQSYNAYLGFQTDVWDYRDEYEKDFNSKDYDFVNQAMVGGEPTDVSKVKIENATITDNGTYSVSMTGADLSGGTEFRMLYISTDIPAAMKDVKFSDIKVIIDGTEVATLKDGVVKKEVQDGSKKYYMIMAVNIYGEEGKDLPEAITYTMPQNSVELQFTVSGLDMGQDYSTKTYGAKKGATFTSGNFKYKVTTASKITAGKVTKGKAQVVGLSAAGKKKASVSVPASVSYTSNKQKATYTVNAVAASAFKKATKLKTVTLSKNIKSIKKATFQNCTKLTTLKLNAKLTSVAKDSFKGCTKTITVKGTSKTDNVKLLKKKNASVKFK